MMVVVVVVGVVVEGRGVGGLGAEYLPLNANNLCMKYFVQLSVCMSTFLYVVYA